MTPVAEQLAAIRSHVGQRHTLVAQHMLDPLIADVEREAELQRIVNTPSPRRTRTNGRKPAGCRFGARYTKTGKRMRTRHKCGPECSWGPEGVRDWLSRPYHIRGAEMRETRLVPVPSCANCDRSRSDHWEPAADPDTGRLTGYRAIKECTYTPVEA